jgi:hypothetical protein
MDIVDKAKSGAADASLWRRMTHLQVALWNKNSSRLRFIHILSLIRSQISVSRSWFLLLTSSSSHLDNPTGALIIMFRTQQNAFDDAIGKHAYDTSRPGHHH